MGNLERRYIILCMAAVLIFHIVYHILSQPVQPNTYLFVQIGENLLRKGMYSFDGIVPTRSIQPVYTLFVTLFYHLLGLKAFGVVAAQTVLDLIAFYLILRIAFLIYGSQIPKLLPLILAGDIAIWFFGLYIINEPLFIFITVCSVYFLVKAVKFQNAGDFILCGLLAGTAMLTRPVGLGFIAFLVFPLLLFWKGMKKPLSKLLLVYLPLLAIITPWTLRNAIVMGKFTPLSSEDRYHLLYSSLPDSVTETNDYVYFDPIGTEPDRVADSTNIYMTAIKNILSNPFPFIKRGVQKNITVWTNFPGTRELQNIHLKIFAVILQYGILILTVIGFIKTEKKFALLLIFPAASYGFVLFFTYATTRFAVPAMPFLLILTAKGAEAIMNIMVNAGRSMIGLPQQENYPDKRAGVSQAE